MRHRKPRRFRHRSNGRSHQHRINGKEQTLLGSSSFSNDRRGIFKSYQSPDKLVEKYNSLAKEALTSGDRTLSENYYQHADHFMRIVYEKNLAQKQNNSQINEQKVVADEKNLTNKSKGIYFLEIETTDGVINKKLILQ